MKKLLMSAAGILLLIGIDCTPYPPYSIDSDGFIHTAPADNIYCDAWNTEAVDGKYCILFYWEGTR